MPARGEPGGRGMDYEIRAMTVAEILDTGFRLLREHALLLIGITACLHLPIALASLWLTASPEVLAEDPGAILESLGGVALVFAALVLLSPIATAAITHALREVLLGRETTLGRSLRFGLSIVLPLVGTQLLAGLLMLFAFTAPLLLVLLVPRDAWPLGLVVLAPVSVFLATYLVLAFLILTQVIVIEEVFGTRALRRSSALMKGHKLRGLGIVMVGAILISVLQAGFGLVLAAFPLASALGSGLGQAAGSAFLAAVTALFYFDLRCRKEAFDLEHLAQRVAGGARPMPPPIA